MPFLLEIMMQMLATLSIIASCLFVSFYAAPAGIYRNWKIVIFHLREYAIDKVTPRLKFLKKAILKVTQN